MTEDVDMCCTIGECPPLQSDYGGNWHCSPQVDNLLLPVPDGSFCVLECYEEDVDGLACNGGEWSPGSPGDTVCNFCPPLPEVESAELSCSTEYIRPNTSCSYQCQSEEFYFTGERSRTCQQDGSWSGSHLQFSCQPRGTEESLLVVGGLYPQIWPHFVSVVDEFTGSRAQNRSVPSLPSGLAYLTAAGLGGLVSACFGERDCDDCPEPQPECLLWQEGTEWFNPGEDAAYSPPAVVYRENADSVVVNNTVWIIGGKHRNQSLISSSTVEIFRPGCLADPGGDCSFWVAGPELPYTVYDSCSVEVGGSVLVSGGHGPGYPGQYVYDKLIKFELAGGAGNWELLPQLPVDRYGHGCAQYGGELYLSGGYSWTEDRLGRLDVFSPDTAQWRQLAELAVPRNNHRMVVLNNILTVVGGYGAPASEYWAPQDLDTFEEYHPDTDQWILRQTKLSVPRRSFGAAIITRK